MSVTKGMISPSKNMILPCVLKIWLFVQQKRIFQNRAAVFPKNTENYEVDENIRNEIINKCNGAKNKRKCIKKAIRKTCRNKGNSKKKCKRTLKDDI